MTWSLDASAAVIMRSGMVKKYFSDKAGVADESQGTLDSLQFNTKHQQGDDHLNWFAIGSALNRKA